MTEVRPRGGGRLAVEMGAENNNLVSPPRGQLSGNSLQCRHGPQGLLSPVGSLPAYLAHCDCSMLSVQFISSTMRHFLTHAVGEMKDA